MSDSLFEAFNPNAARRTLAVTVRPATVADADAIARVYVQRHGDPQGDAVHGVRRHLNAIADGAARDHVFVGCSDGRVVGYGRCGYRDWPTVAVGWFLLGLIVEPEYRRAGLGRALTLRRMQCIAREGADSVWYFTSSANTVSLHLHERLGFQSVATDVMVPGVDFSGGVGLLLRANVG